jgi:hypothetical protein
MDSHLGRKGFDFQASTAHGSDRLGGHTVDVGEAVDDGTPSPAESLGALVAELRRGEISGGLRVCEQVTTIQGTALVVGSHREIRDDGMHVQLRIEVARRAMGFAAATRPRNRPSIARVPDTAASVDAGSTRRRSRCVCVGDRLWEPDFGAEVIVTDHRLRRATSRVKRSNSSMACQVPSSFRDALALAVHWPATVILVLPGEPILVFGSLRDPPQHRSSASHAASAGVSRSEGGVVLRASNARCARF